MSCQHGGEQQFGVSAQFELRGVPVSFFIKPANGLQLPEIMKCRCAV
jgi:hypothetical protein